MQLTSSTRNGVQVISPDGRIDHQHSDDFLRQIEPFVAACAASLLLVLDLDKVEYISSVGLRALMVTAKRISAQGGKLVIAALQPAVREVFEISRFHLLFKIYDSVDAAAGAHI